ncbi:helix-turn-helix domain-containing protein [Thalassospiraceae bacterium LMO-JJ14]|nr:helix-turn-helix domain-containing protein [Thalassospiraceae bacterium LMO-JJ14]
MLSKPLLTIHEVAALLKMRESTVRAWINDGQLRAIKFGRDWRVAQRDLEAYLDAHANRQPEPGETPQPDTGDISEV